MPHPSPFTNISIKKWHLHQLFDPGEESFGSTPAMSPRIGHFSTGASVTQDPADLKHIHSIDFGKDSSCKARVEAGKITIEIN